MKLVRTHLKVLLREQGLSMRSCARLTGISQSTLLAWCNEPLDRLDCRVLARLCHELRVGLPELVYLA